MITHTRFRINVIKTVFILCMVTVALAALPTTKTSAFSWTNQTPEISTSTEIGAANQNYCPAPNFHKMFAIDGDIGMKSVCVSEGEKISLGTYYSNLWGGFVTVIKFGNDTTMHLLRGNCNTYDSCQYIQEQDMLIAKQDRVYGFSRSLVIYKNFSKHLTSMANGITREYYFDYSNPDYTFQDTIGRTWAINSTGASENGKWLAVELLDEGFSILNLETLKMKYISTDFYHYGWGSNPSAEIAVSNDGEHIAVMGMNSGIRIFDINSDCGTDITNSDTSYVPLKNPCKQANIDYGSVIDQFFAGLSPRFSEDGGELRFYAVSYNYLNKPREVVYKANGYVTKKLDYLALGDSFTSGEGETDDKYYLPGTNEKYEKCHISSRSYPFLIANVQNINSDSVKSVACSGAVIDDVVGKSGDYYGQANRLKEAGLNLNSTDLLLAQSLAKETFIPGRTYQKAFAEKYTPDVITVSIGGNDAGLMGKLTTCLLPGTCNWVENLEDREQTADEIQNLFSKLVNAYKDLHTKSPNSKIYAIGYPKIIDPNGQCDLVTGIMFNSEEREFMNEGIAYLNKVIQSATKAAGIGYIDIENSLGDNVLCGSKDPAVMNSVRLGDDNRYAWVINIGNESFHPTPLGHEFIARTINNAVSNLKDSEYCPNYLKICPDNSVMAPKPSSYWMPEGNHNYPIQKVSNFIVPTDNSGDKQHVSLDEFSLAPNSNVEIEIHSTTQSLGHFTSNNDGSLDIDITLPMDLEYGIHTVHLYGTSYSGESIELYQFIEYREKPQEVTKNEDITANPTISQVKTKETKIDTSITNNQTESVDSAPAKTVATIYNPEVKGISTVAPQKTTAILSGNTTKQKPIQYQKIAIVALIILVIISSVVIIRRKLFKNK